MEDVPPRGLGPAFPAGSMIIHGSLISSSRQKSDSWKTNLRFASDIGREHLFGALSLESHCFLRWSPQRLLKHVGDHAIYLGTGHMDHKSVNVPRFCFLEGQHLSPTHTDRSSPARPYGNG